MNCRCFYTLWDVNHNDLYTSDIDVTVENDTNVGRWIRIYATSNSDVVASITRRIPEGKERTFTLQNVTRATPGLKLYMQISEIDRTCIYEIVGNSVKVSDCTYWIPH
jgi:hypothetical protein